MSFSGIFILNPSEFIKNTHLRTVFFGSTIFWIVAIIGIFSIFIYNGSESLIVILYVVVIGIMAWISRFGLGYRDRSIMFRLMIVLASGLCIYSDSLIGNSQYGDPKFDDLFFLIDVTYVINLFLMLHAMLFLRDSQPT